MDFQETDFKDFIDYIENRFNLVPDSKLKKLLDKFHIKVYSISIINFELEKQKIERDIFLKEIYSCSIQIMPILLNGFIKPTFLLSRSIIESFFKHIYYQQHPVEYSQLDWDLKSYIKTEDLFSYLTKHPLFFKDKRMLLEINDLKRIYSEICKFIHSTNRDFINMSKTLEEIKLSSEDIKKKLEYFGKLIDKIILLLLIFHKNIFNRFLIEHQAFLLKNMPRKNKLIFHNL